MCQYGKSFAVIVEHLFRTPSSILNDIWLRVTTLARLVTIYSQARKASGVNNDAHRRSSYLFFRNILIEFSNSYNQMAIISKLFSTAWQKTCLMSCKALFF